MIAGRSLLEAEDVQEPLSQNQESDRFKRYQEKQRQWRKKRNQEHREKYGCSYVTYRRRLILEERAKLAG